MKHRGYNREENWLENGYKHLKQRQTEIIKKAYSDYCDQDCVLWVIPELYHNLAVAKLTGTIRICKKDGKEIEFGRVLRTPYPNKRIRQLSRTNGRSRLYGIPLVFQSFDELCEIAEITIQWDILEKWSLGDNDEKPLDIQVRTIIIKYHVSFEVDKLDPSCHAFTVFSKDSAPCAFDDDLMVKKYFTEFDTAMTVAGSLIFSDEEHEFAVCDIIDLKPNTNGTDESPLTEAEKRVINSLEAILPINNDLHIARRDVVIDNEVQWELHYYEKTEILYAASTADVVI